MEVQQLVTDLVANLGIVGALVWYLYYTTSVTLPKRDQHYTDSVERIAEGFRTMMQEERAYRQQELEELKQWFDDHGCRYNADHPGG